MGSRGASCCRGDRAEIAGTDTAKAEAHFERALTVVRKQKIKSRELRAAVAWHSSDAIRIGGRRLAIY